MPFGRALLAQWALDPAGVYLNHGTVGSPPLRGIEMSCRRWPPWQWPHF